MILSTLLLSSLLFAPPPWFVPQERLSLAGDDAREALAQIAAVQWDADRCLPPIETDIDAESAGMAQFPSLPRFLGASKAVVVGRVRALTPGWDVRLRRPATLVTLDAVETLRGPVLPGERTYELESGRIEAAGRALCMEPRGAVPKVGDTLLVAGATDDGAPAFIASCPDCAFAVENGVIVVPPSLNLAGDRRVPLDALRKTLKERTQKP
jgi:hypothetical protein